MAVAEADQGREPRVLAPLADPLGDEFGDEFYDLIGVSVLLSARQLAIDLEFDGPIADPDMNKLGLQGTIDLDLDRDAATGGQSNADFYRPADVAGATGLGVDAHVDLFSYRQVDGSADLVVDGYLAGRVPVTFEPRRLKVEIEAHLIGQPAALDLAVMVGTNYEPSDVAPNDGAISAFVDPVILLLDGRFELRTSWRDFDDRSGSGREAWSSRDSAVIYFFGASNWEILAKVLDGCGVNGHWWVFFSGSTNVEFELEVLDTWTGAVQRYGNPLGRTALTVTDTAAFVCG